MPEPSRRETHLLSGLGLQVLVVALLVFIYTQAARQLNYQRGQFLRLQEQVAAAKVEVAKAGKPDLEKLRAEVEGLKSRLVTLQFLSDWAEVLGPSVRDRFGFQDVTFNVGGVEKTMNLNLGDKPAVEIRLVGLEFRGTSTTRNAAAFLESLAPSNLKLLCPLHSMGGEAQAADQPFPAVFRIKWLIAVSSESSQPSSGSGSTSFPLPERKEGPPLTWGWREEPFLSPFVSPRAVQTPTPVRKRFRLTGILWDPNTPTCVINGAILKLGDLLEGYQVTLIAQNAVLLHKGEEEIFLPLP